MLQNAYLLAKIGDDTAENERNLPNVCQKTDNYPTGPLPYGPQGAKSREVLAVATAYATRRGHISDRGPLEAATATLELRQRPAGVPF